MDAYKDFWGPSASFFRHMGYRPRSSIPNADGCKVEVILLDSSIVYTKVILKDGIHRLQDVTIDKVAAWKPVE